MMICKKHDVYYITTCPICDQIEREESKHEKR